MWHCRQQFLYEDTYRQIFNFASVQKQSKESVEINKNNEHLPKYLRRNISFFEFNKK